MRESGRVLFIVHDVYQDDNTFPLGIGYLSAVLRKSGVDVTVYCQDIYHYSNDELAQFLLQNEFDVIGLSFMAARFKETIVDLCKVINECKEGAWFVLGGHGPSPIPEYMLDKTKADIIAIGEAEETIVELLQCKLTVGSDLSKIKGIAYRKNNSYYVNQRRLPVADLDSIPFPDWSLFPLEEYATCLKFFAHQQNDRYMALLTSRGCVGQCNFCYRIEKGLRLRSINNIIEEIKLLNSRFGINYFYFFDELFILSKKRLKEFYNALNLNKLKIKFSCSVRVELVDEELLSILKECGCTFLNYGMESSSQKVLNLMNKKTTVAQNIRAAELTKKADIGMGLNFLWGNKGDTEETLKSNVAFIKQYNTHNQLRTIRSPTPYPVCDLYYEAIRRGLLSGPEDFFERFKNSDLLTVNFTDIPDNTFYQLLFEANKELIIDHFTHTSGNMDEARELIEQFYDLYFRGISTFRGARHYKRTKVAS